MSGESFKGGLHYLVGSLALTMACYSSLRLTESSDHRIHLLLNVLVYLALWAFEAYQAASHWGRAG